MSGATNVRPNLSFLAWARSQLAFLLDLPQRLGALMRIAPATVSVTSSAAGVARPLVNEAGVAYAIAQQSGGVAAPPVMPATFPPPAPTMPVTMHVAPAFGVLNAPFKLATQGAYDLMVDVFFNARHYVAIDGRRGPIHSHSFRLQVRCAGELLDRNQCVAGFADIKRAGDQVAAQFGNQLLNEMPIFAGLQPTSECLVTVIAHRISPRLRDLPIRLTSVTLWEAPSVSITYTLDQFAHQSQGRAQEAPIVVQ